MAPHGFGDVCLPHLLLHLFRVLAFQRLKLRYCLFSTFLQINDRPWVSTRNHAALGRIVDALVIQLCQLRHPLADKLTFRIETLALSHRVEHTEVRRRVGACRGAPLPAAVVGGQKTIHQF